MRRGVIENISKEHSEITSPNLLLGQTRFKPRTGLTAQDIQTRDGWLFHSHIHILMGSKNLPCTRNEFIRPTRIKNLNQGELMGINIHDVVSAFLMDLIQEILDRKRSKDVHIGR